MEIRSEPRYENATLLSYFKAALSRELSALEQFVQRIPEKQLLRVLEILLSCRGKIIVIGVGKSGLIGRKISATLSSTGSPSVYVNASECAHGDMGVITSQDVVWLISNSGRTSEILALLPYFETHRLPVIALIGTSGSPLEVMTPYHVVLPAVVEADRQGLVPSSSTTVMLAVGDAVALTLMECKKISRDQFASWHPGGWLGKQLATQVKHLIHGPERCPLVDASRSLKTLLPQMTQIHLGVLVAEVAPKYYGVFTDGDLRRALQSHRDVLDQPLRSLVHLQPATIGLEARAQEALSLMESRKITQLVVVDHEGIYAGVVHIHDLLEFREI